MGTKTNELGLDVGGYEDGDEYAKNNRCGSERQ